MTKDKLNQFLSCLNYCLFYCLCVGLANNLCLRAWVGLPWCNGYFCVTHWFDWRTAAVSWRSEDTRISNPNKIFKLIRKRNLCSMNTSAHTDPSLIMAGVLVQTIDLSDDWMWCFHSRLEALVRPCQYHEYGIFCRGVKLTKLTVIYTFTCFTLII